MLTLNFEGWFQNRMATNPDPTDELSGKSGTTFIVAGEPYLDRTIRLQDPVALRYPRTLPGEFGVIVRSVTIRDADSSDRPRQVSDHPLLGAKVELLDGAKYEQQNLILVTAPFDTPIDPFHIRISGNGIVLQRKDVWDLDNPDLTVRDMTEIDPSSPQFRRRINEPPALRSAAVAEATGISDYAAYRRNRKAELEKLLKNTTDETEQLALRKRIHWLEKDKEYGGLTLAALQFLGMIAQYKFDVNGPPEYTTVIDKKNLLKGRVGTAPDWPLEFWMGAYDADTLCGYMKGSLSVPFHPD